MVQNIVENNQDKPRNCSKSCPKSVQKNKKSKNITIKLNYKNNTIIQLKASLTN